MVQHSETASSIGPGTGYRLPGRSLIRTAWLDELGEILAREAEPKRFSFLDRADRAPSELTLLALPRTRIYGMSHGSAVCCHTERLDCFEFMFVIDGQLVSGEGAVRQRIGAGEAVLHLPGGRHCATWEPGSRAIILRIEPGVLGPFGYDPQRLTELGRLSPVRSLSLVSGLGRALGGICGQICEEADRSASLAEQARQEDLLLYAVELTVESLTDPAARRAGNRFLPPCLKCTLEYIHANLDRKLDVRALASVAGVSVRTLQQAFADHLGEGPLAFVRRTRLQRIRDELSRADPWETTVTEVAVRWGFTHLSNFSSNYKRMFGESPSLTLKRHRIGNAGAHTP